MSIKEILNAHRQGSGQGFEVRVEFRRMCESREEALRTEGMVKSHIAKASDALSYGLSPCITIRGGMKDFLRHQKAIKKNRPTTLGDYRRALTFFAGQLSRGAGDISLDRITITDLEILIDKMQNGKFGKKYCDSTINKYLAALKSYGYWAVGRRLVPQNTTLPWLGMKRITIFKPEYEVMSRKEMEKYLIKWPKKGKHVSLVLWAMLFTGARPIVMLELKWGQIKIEGKEGYFPLRRLKKGNLVAVSFETGSSIHRLLLQAKETFKELRGRYPRKSDHVFVPKWGRTSGGGWRQSTFSNAVRHHLKGKQKAYNFMHSITTAMVREKVSPDALKNYRGHTNINTQRIYTHTSAEDGREVRECVDDMFGAAFDKAMGAKPDKISKPLSDLTLESIII